MAIDSTNKRKSAIQMLPHVVYPVGDMVIDDFDRMQVAWLYAIGAGAAAVTTIITPGSRQIIAPFVTRAITPEINPTVIIPRPHGRIITPEQ